MSALRRFRSYQRLLAQDFRRTETIGLIVISLGLGIFTGTVCSLFEYIPDVIISLRVRFLPELGHGALFWLAAFSLSFILAGTAMYITARIAPEAGGSGIPEIEGALLSLRPVRWKRVLPVKFFTGLLSLGSGMILGREGPSIQLGGAAGAMFADLSRGTSRQFRRHALVAAGAAAGLTSAFNAPLAGILFVYEELRAQFRFSFASIQAVMAAVLAACCVRQMMFGSDPVFDVPDYEAPALVFLIFCAVLGVFTGVVGSLFNYLVEKTQNFYGSLSKGKVLVKTLAAAVVGGAFGCITFLLPDASGSGMSSIPSFITGSRGIKVLRDAALLLLGDPRGSVRAEPCDRHSYRRGVRGVLPGRARSPGIPDGVIRGNRDVRLLRLFRQGPRDRAGARHRDDRRLRPDTSDAHELLHRDDDRKGAPLDPDLHPDPDKDAEGSRQP